MIFNSVTYFLLLLVVVPMYWALPYRPRLVLIFIASLIFYGFWRVDFIPLILSSVLVDYFAALKIYNSNQRNKKRYLILSLIFNLGLLFYFKYIIFFSENAIGFANLLGLEVDPLMLNIILPIGISFYTFQTISYTVDVYRGYITPEKNFILYSCYVTFFPQLIAGPVLRFSEVAPQFIKRSIFKWSDVAIGFKRIIYGLFLKVVLADNIAPMVDAGFDMPIEMLSAIDIWTLAFLFGFQIYFDFSAYSHIAIGSARLMGICFPENFNFPYISKSPKEFWKRWHISLSSWIRDYLYLPLAKIRAHDRSIGGLSNATMDSAKNKALFLTWSIMGLWHGASWTFVLWGIFHSLIIFVYRLIDPLITTFKTNTRALVGVFITLPIIMFSWIPFRANTVDIALEMWIKMLNPFAYNSLNMRENVYLIAALVMVSVFLAFLMHQKLAPYLIKNYPKLFFLVEVVVFAIATPLVLIFLQSTNQFIYFQF